MLIKLRQQLNAHKKKHSNHRSDIRSRTFLINFLRRLRETVSSYKVRGALGLTRWLLVKSRPQHQLIIQRSECFITGRSRGTSQRYTVSRTKIKELASDALLFGTKKAAW